MPMIVPDIMYRPPKKPVSNTTSVMEENSHGNSVTPIASNHMWYSKALKTANKEIKASRMVNISRIMRWFYGINNDLQTTRCLF